MDVESERITIGPLPAKYDRVYSARDRSCDAMYEVNIAQLRCSCPEHKERRAAFPIDDARRVCEHLYDKLYATKVDRDLSALARLFIRYGRRMYEYRMVHDDSGALVIGQPFGAGRVRVLGLIGDTPVVATYEVGPGHWVSGETTLDARMAAIILERMRRTYPEAFRT